MITLTDNAVAELGSLLKDEGQALRLLVQKGGCAGHQYGIKVDSPRPDDTVITSQGGSVVIDPESLTFLQNVVLDYSDGLTEAGFKIVNPNAARSCGCGTSFEPAVEGEVPTYDDSLNGSVCKSEESVS